MKSLRLVGALIAASVALGLSACGVAGPAVAPTTVSVEDLQGATIEAVVGQTVEIDTGDLAVDSYTAEIADATIAEFVQGRDDSYGSYNPGLTPLAVGETEVTLTNEDGGIEPIVFTLRVT
jgi:hypothetical protein